MIKVVFKFKLKPDVSVEDYLVIAREAISETRKEKGCISYTINVDINDPSILTMLEEWEDQESLNQHNKNEMFKKLFKSLKNFEKVQKSTFIEKWNNFHS